MNAYNALEPRHLMAIPISGELLLELMKEPKGGAGDDEVYLEVNSIIPDDAKLAWIDWGAPYRPGRTVYLIAEHPSFTLVEGGQPIPMIDPLPEFTVKGITNTNLDI